MIVPLRMAHSPFCENRCSYCSATHSKSKFEIKNLPPFPTIFPCNTIYRSNAKELIAKLSSLDVLEIHGSAFAQPHHKTKLELVQKHSARLIIIIDHLRPDWEQLLAPWDILVQEYRIIPSNEYSPELFLQKLPVFVLKKMRWALPNNVPQLTCDKVYSLFFKKPMDLWQNRWSQTLWDRTTITRPVFYSQTSFVSCLNSKDIGNDWPSHLNVAASEYVGIFDASVDLTKYEDLIKASDLVLWSFPSQIKAEDFYLLNNFVIRRSLWRDFLQQSLSVDIFSWNFYIAKNSLKIHRLDLIPTPPLHSVDLCKQIQHYFMAHPQEDFYKKYFLWMGENYWFRKYASAIIYFILSFLPQKNRFAAGEKWICFIEHILRWRDLSKEYLQLLAQKAKISIAPLLGFLRELCCFPPEWEQMPLQKRWPRKLSLFLKRWGWLGKKVLGLS